MKGNLKHKYRHKDTAGFTLFEILLVVAVSATLLLSGIKILDGYTNNIADEKEARYLVQIMNYAQAYVENNFEYIWTNPALMNEGYNDYPLGGGNGVFDGADDIISDINGDGLLNNLDLISVNRVVRLGVNAAIVGNPADFFLQDIVRGTAPAAALQLTPLKYNANIYVRNRGYVSGKRSLEVFVITDSNIQPTLLSYARVNNITSIIGSDAGAWGRIDPVTQNIFAGGFCAAGNIVQSINGTWQLNAADLNIPFAINPNNAYCPAIAPPANGEGAYVALRRVVEHQEQYMANVLYKNDIIGRPELARMQANLNMRGNAISAVQAMSADRLVVERDLNINSNGSQIFIDETGRFAGPNNRVTATPVAPAIAPGRTCQWLPGTPRTLDPVAGGNCDLQGGNLLITGNSPVPANEALELQTLNANAAMIEVDNITANITRVSNQVNISSNVNIGSVQTGNATVDDLNVVNNVQTLNIISEDLDVANMATVAAIQTDDIRTDRVNAQTANVRSVSPFTGNMDVINNMRVNGDLNAGQARINTLSDCDATIILRMDLDADLILYEMPDDLETVPLYDCVLGP